MPDVQRLTGIRTRFTTNKVTRSRLVDGVVLEELDVTAQYEKDDAGQWTLRSVDG
jgi:hypothetical protein